MVDTRTVTLPAIWADDAITEIPTPPIANTTYRNTDLGSTELLQGWPYQKIVDSADFNQTLWLISNLVKSCEQYGIMPWCASTTYKQNGICLASNGIFYWAKKDNTGVNPVTDSGMTNWGVFLDPGDNFVTETVLMSQINLCEKLANKTQTLSSSSTTTQYPSAKAVYDNINNLNNSKQNNITGGASTITTSNLTTNRALVSDGSGKVAVSAVTNTELGYLDGVTSNIQTQLNGKQASGSYMTLSGNESITGVKTVENNNPEFGFKNTLADISNKPYAPINSKLFFLDKNGLFTGEIRNELFTTGYSQIAIYTNSKTSGTLKTSYIKVVVDENGEVYALCPTPSAADDNSTKISNTQWVNSRITSIMNTIYPVGSLYFGTQSTCPLQSLGIGTWKKVGTSLTLSVNTSVPVKGNGIVLGMTNGSTNFGIRNQGGSAYKSALMGYTGLYGGKVGDASSGTEIGTNIGVGLTTVSSKSGIVGTVTRTQLTVNVFQRTA